MPRKSRILAVGLALAAVVAAGTFTFIHNSPAAHAGGTGGGCISTTGAPVCTVKGNSAFAEFESFTDCVGTQAFVNVSDQVSHNPPAAANTSLGVFVGISQFDFCAGTSIKDIFGQSSDATFTVNGSLDAATLVASIPVTDFDSGATGTITVNLTFQGFGPISQQVDSNHFRTAGFLLNSHFNGDSRAARASGTLSDGVTNFAASPTVFADLAANKGGTLLITH